jgi:hypothetical protein
MALPRKSVKKNIQRELSNFIDNRESHSPGRSDPRISDPGEEEAGQDRGPGAWRADLPEARFGEQGPILLGGSGSTLTHGEEIEAEVGISDGLRPSIAGHRFSDKKGAFGGKGFPDGPEDPEDFRVLVIVQDPNEGDEVMARGERVPEEVTTVDPHPILSE